MKLPLALLTCSALLSWPAVSFADTIANQLTESEARSGWQLLFDGKSTDGWRNYKKDGISDGWQIIDGALVRNQGGAGDIITNEKYDAFELSLEYKISEGGNSGVMFHVVEGSGPPWHSGPEIQVQDNVNGHDPQKSGWLYQLYQPTAPGSNEPIDATRPAGEWNQLYVRIADDQCEVCINGIRYYRFNIGSKDWNQKVAKSKFSQFEGFGKAGEGHVCLQDHGDVVAYRSIKVRRIGEDGSVPQPIDGKLGMKGELAFPDLQWDQWEPVDEAGNVKPPLRLMELTYADGMSDRIFVASQGGAIWTFENRPDVKESQLVLDLRDKVQFWKGRGANEQGLLGLAMHPKFASNGQFFVYYSDAEVNKSVLSRFTMSQDQPLRADPASEEVLMEIDQPFQNHNGGAIEFGPDGYLYIGLGDGGLRNDPHGNGQNLSTLLGSILRIDVDNKSPGLNYGIPSDNPFVGRADARGEIFAFGLRNPWRIAFDNKTGHLWCGDVGQELWEEVNVITKGGNYGWSNREGSHAFGNSDPVSGVSDPIEPVWEYDHQIGKSITGGRVYRSSRLPALEGKYLYADYVTGSVWALSYDPESGEATRNEQVIPESVAVLAFGEDAGGEVYYLTDSTRGQCIYKFQP